MSAARVALVVATDRYDDPTLHGLAAPSADADALAEVLGDARLGGFDVDVLRNAPSFAIAERVEGLFSGRHPSDVVLLHFSCHGLKDESGELFLAATNTSPTRLASTAVDAALVNRLMGRTRAQSVVLLLDCCYGGAFERGLIHRSDGDAHVGEQFDGLSDSGRGRVVITASSAMEYALEGTTLTSGGRPAPSLFTGALTDGIRSGEADRDQDGRVGLNELYDFVYDTVRARTPNQTPSRWDFGVQGDVVIARNPRRRIVPAPLPREVLDLVEHTSAGVRLGAVEEVAGIATRENLGMAAGAVVVLRQLVGDDSRRVSSAAHDALVRLEPRTTPTAVDLGPVPAGSSSPAATVTVEGSPLALSSAVATTSADVHAELDGSVLSVRVSGRESGPVNGVVTLTSATGDASVQVTATIVATDDLLSPPERQPSEADKRRLGPDQSPPPQAAPDPPFRPPRPALVVPLVFVGATAAVAANLLKPPEHEGFVALGDLGGIGWLYVSAAVALLAIAGLFTPRWFAVAVGMIAGSAAWSSVFWARATVSGWTTDGVGLGGTFEGTLSTGLWVRLVGSCLLGVAAVVCIAGYAPLGWRVALRRDVWALVGATLILGGVALRVIEPFAQAGQARATAGTLTPALAALLLCLPIALLRFNVEQQRAALVAASVLLIVPAARGGWVLMVSNPGETLSNRLTTTVAGSLVTLVGCYIGQIHTRAAALPPRTQPPAARLIDPQPGHEHVVDVRQQEGRGADRRRDQPPRHPMRPRGLRDGPPRGDHRGH